MGSQAGPTAREAALARGNPIEDDGGATFVWTGDEPPPIVVGSWCDWDPRRGLALEPAPEGDAWFGWVALPNDAYVEYVLLRDGARIADPLNPNRVRNGVGGRNNRFWMPGARRRAEALHARRLPRGSAGSVARGKLRLSWMAAPPRERRLDLYRPAASLLGGTDAHDLPLLVVLDGADYLDRGRLHRTLDALLADGRMAPVAAAFIDNAGPARGTEYAANDFSVAVLADEVVPAAEHRLALHPQRRPAAPGRATILGSSMGGLMALHAATRRPEVFGAAICQSTSAMVEPEDFPEDWGGPVVRLTTIALIESTPPQPIRLWLDVGELEGLARANDRLAGLLERRGYDGTYRRYPGGHDQASWAESLVDALPAMFPPGEM